MPLPSPDPGLSRPDAAARLVAGRKRIMVAMSGGVDSAVTAALLAAEGHDVIGVTMQLYDQGEATGRRGSCCAGQDIHDARRAAAIIGIPHYVLNYEARFRTAVIDAFADSYMAGETPIPCVACNARLKFVDLLDTAADLDCELMATGHYIARREGERGIEMRRAADGDRDQSYFLFQTTAGQLARLCFPLGELRKSEVRALAARFGLPIADKPDSQDICFVPKGRYTDVIRRIRPGAGQPGEIVHVDGRVIGRHDGISGFTIGQRRGLGVTGSEPLFVVRIEAAAGRVVVGPRESLLTNALALREVNWLGAPDLADGRQAIDVHVKLRSQQVPQPATLRLGGGGRALVELRQPDYGIAAGQACVFYADGSARSVVLGGGFIVHSSANPHDHRLAEHVFTGAAPTTHASST